LQLYYTPIAFVDPLKASAFLNGIVDKAHGPAEHDVLLFETPAELVEKLMLKAAANDTTDDSEDDGDSLLSTDFGIGDRLGQVHVKEYKTTRVVYKPGTDFETPDAKSWLDDVPAVLGLSVLLKIDGVQVRNPVAAGVLFRGVPLLANSRYREFFRKPLADAGASDAVIDAGARAPQLLKLGFGDSFRLSFVSPSGKFLDKACFTFLFASEENVLVFAQPVGPYVPAAFKTGVMHVPVHVLLPLVAGCNTANAFSTGWTDLTKAVSAVNGSEYSARNAVTGIVEPPAVPNLAPIMRAIAAAVADGAPAILAASKCGYPEGLFMPEAPDTADVAAFVNAMKKQDSGSDRARGCHSTNLL
jgi:hypothetical protein